MAGCPPPTPSPNRRAGPAGFSSWHLRAPARAPRFALPPARPPAGHASRTSPSAAAASGSEEFSSAPAGSLGARGREAAEGRPARGPARARSRAPKVGARRARGWGRGGGGGGDPARARRPGTHRGVRTRPALSRCHRPAPARKPEPARGSPPPLSARRRAERQQVPRHRAKNTGAGRSAGPGRAPGPGPPAPRPRPARQLLEGSLHCVPHPRVCWASSREAGSGDEAPAAEPRGAGAGRLRRARWPSGRGGRPAGGRVLRLLGGRHPRPMEVRRSQLHGVAALPPASPAARVNGPRGRRGRPG